MIGAASMAVRDCIAVTKVAARPAAGPSPKRSAAATDSAGLRTAVAAPTRRQKAARAKNSPDAPNAADAPSKTRLPAIAFSFGRCLMRGASPAPTKSAATSLNPRRLRTAATPHSADSDMVTRNVLKTVKGKGPTAEARSIGHNAGDMRRLFGTGCSSCVEPELFRGRRFGASSLTASAPAGGEAWS